MFARSVLTAARRGVGAWRTSASVGSVGSNIRCMSSGNGVGDIFSPTPDHQALRDMVRSWVEAEVDPQANEFNREEKLNRDLFRCAVACWVV